MDYLQITKKYFEEATPQNAVKASAIIGGADPNGFVTVEYDFVGDEGNDYSIIVSDANSGDDDVDMTVDYADGVITVNLGTDPDAVAGATIGSGEDGEVDIVLDTSTGIDGNDYTVAVVEGADGGNMSAGLVGTDITVTLGMTTATIASATIGSGATGTVDIDTVETGDAMNDYTVEVVTNSTDGQDLDATLTEDALVITLGNDDGDSATSTIGTGTDGSVEIEVDAAGSAGNSYTVEVDASITVQDRVLAAALVGTDLVVELATEGDANAQATIGSGANGQVFIVADTAGTDANSIVVEVDADITVPVRALSVNSPSPEKLDVLLATEAVTEATVDIGTGEDGVVTIDTIGKGAGGNLYNVEIVAGAGVLDVSVNQYDIVITLAAGGNTATQIADNINLNHAAILSATASGAGTGTFTESVSAVFFTGGTNQLKTADNTANLVAAEIQATIDFSASASGDGTTSLTLAESSNFSGGTNKLATASNTANLVAAAINDGTAGLTATATGTGLDSLALSETQKNFTGGGANVALDPLKNTALLVATLINATYPLVFLATESGDGSGALTIAEAVQSFAGGTDSVPDDAKNTATLIATAISLLANLTATASGTGATALDTPETVQFVGDTNTGEISTVKNTATLISDAISAIDNFTAVANGDGSGSITVAEGEQSFAGGQYATPAKTATLIMIGNTWYFTNEGGDKYNETLWYSGSPA